MRPLRMARFAAQHLLPAPGCQRRQRCQAPRLGSQQGAPGGTRGRYSLHVKELNKAVDGRLLRLRLPLVHRGLLRGDPALSGPLPGDGAHSHGRVRGVFRRRQRGAGNRCRALCPRYDRRPRCRRKRLHRLEHPARRDGRAQPRGQTTATPRSCTTVPHAASSSNRSFDYIGHMTRYIKPGAQVFTTSSYTAALETLGARNPDGDPCARCSQPRRQPPPRNAANRIQHRAYLGSRPQHTDDRLVARKQDHHERPHGQTVPALTRQNKKRLPT